MPASDPKPELKGYLQDARGAFLWKLDGLSEYDARRPMVRTGTNLLGLVKHMANVEMGYFGLTFDRPFDGPLPWTEDGEPELNADMWATAEESREEIVDLYRRAGGPALPPPHIPTLPVPRAAALSAGGPQQTTPHP